MANVIITGANQGIGYYMVEAMLAGGNVVGVLDMEIDRLLNLQKQYPRSLLPLRCNIQDANAVIKCVGLFAEGFHTIDVAIHNACCCSFSPLEETEEDVFHKVFDVNYYGGLRFIKAVLPHMVRQSKGKIMLTSSGVGVTGFFNISPYASSKGALEALVKCLKIEYQDKGITFHLLHPPPTRTKSSAPLPVPTEFMADPKVVGYGLAKKIASKQFLLCHSVGQKIQIKLCYRFPLLLGKLMGKMALRCADGKGR